MNAQSLQDKSNYSDLNSLILHYSYKLGAPVVFKHALTNTVEPHMFLNLKVLIKEGYDFGAHGAFPLIFLYKQPCLLS